MVETNTFEFLVVLAITVVILGVGTGAAAWLVLRSFFSGFRYTPRVYVLWMKFYEDQARKVRRLYRLLGAPL